MKQLTSPGSIHEISAQGWCTGMTQRDGMDREHMYTHGGFMSMYGKNHYDIVK